MRSFALLVLFCLVCYAWARSCPDSISTNIIYNGDDDDQRLSDVYDTLTNCSHIKSLDLKLSRHGCIVGDQPYSFSFSPEDRFPALSSLRLDGYCFESTYSDSSEKTFHWQSYWYRVQKHIAQTTGLWILLPKDPLEIEPPPPSNLDMWKVAMDWTKVEQLDIKRVSQPFIEGMTGQLPSLQSLSLGMGWAAEQDQIIDRTSRFLAETPSLSMLSLYGYTDLLNWTEVLSKHGNSLKNLSIHTWESNGPSRPRPTFSLSQIRQVNELCPYLEDLTLDINRNRTWPTDILDSLAHFQQVRKLGLWIEVGMNEQLYDDDWDDLPSDGRDRTVDFRLPRLNASSALTLFKRLRSQKQGVQLQKVTLYLDDWDDFHFGSGWLYGGGYNSPQEFECSALNERGQQKPEGMAWCVKYPE